MRGLDNNDIIAGPYNSTERGTSKGLPRVCRKGWDYSLFALAGTAVDNKTSTDENERRAKETKAWRRHDEETSDYAAWADGRRRLQVSRHGGC
jgi:hypothetical protein